MARQASEYTKAIRNLCSEANFKITHAEARPKLAALGFQLAAEPGDKSANYQVWHPVAQQYVYPTGGDEAEVHAYYETTVKQAGLDVSLIPAIRREDQKHRAYVAERNNFDVTKFNWRKRQLDGGSRKPVSAKSRPAATVQRGKAVTLRPTNGKPKSVDDNFSAARFVVEQGGAAVVQQKLDELIAQRVKLEGEIAHLSDVLDKAASVGKMLPSREAA